MNSIDDNVAMQCQEAEHAWDQHDLITWGNLDVSFKLLAQLFTICKLKEIFAPFSAYLLIKLFYIYEVLRLFSDCNGSSIASYCYDCCSYWSAFLKTDFSFIPSEFSLFCRLHFISIFPKKF